MLFLQGIQNEAKKIADQQIKWHLRRIFDIRSRIIRPTTNDVPAVTKVQLPL